MNSNNENRTGSHEQQPDPAGARNAAAEARRILVASHGFGMCIMGALILSSMVIQLLAQTGHVNGQRIAAILLMLMGATLMFSNWWTRRIRQRQKVFAIMKGESVSNGKLSMVDVVTVLVGAGCGVVVLLVLTNREAGLGPLVLLVCALAALAGLYRSVSHRLWEFSLGAFGFLLSGALFALLPEGQTWSALLPMGAGVMLTGLLLHLRWRRWVKALPVEEPGVSTGVVGL